jgi:ribosomal protein S8
MNIIKINLLLKKKIVKLKLNKYQLKLIKSLIKINIIKFVKKKSNSNFIIYLNYLNEKPIFQNIINIYKPSKPILVSFKLLKNMTNKHKIILILNTNKGLLTNFEAIQLKIGGQLLLKL